MSALREAMSHAALGWVKPELDETLRQVRNEVEFFVEDPADTSRMRFCAGFLHQVQGTLRMVELYAPAMVAEELEQLALAVGQEQVTDRDEACATLMRGTVLLPDYLERLQNGHRDIPIVLLPLLNEIRAARGASGINESVLFAFAPDSASASDEELEHARGSLRGRNRELLDTVGNVVKEELLRIKDALDLHLRTGGEPSALQTQVNELGAVADTLGMMGLGAARGVVVQQRDALRGVVQAGDQIDESMLLDIAGALLYVDASLDDQVAHLGAAGSGEDETNSSENRRTVEVLAHEAIANFANAREQFVAFIETNWDHTRLADVPRLLGDVAGALRILDLGTPADYLEGVRRYILVELIGRQRVPSGRQLDTLADAMASLEYYLEALRDRRPGREEILDITRTSLEALRYWPLPPLQADEDAAQPSPVADVAPAVAAAAAADAGAVAAPDEPAPVVAAQDTAPEPVQASEQVSVQEPVLDAPATAAPPPLPLVEAPAASAAPSETAPPVPPSRPLVFQASARPFEGDVPAWNIQHPATTGTPAPSVPTAQTAASTFDPVAAEEPSAIADHAWDLAPIELEGADAGAVSSDESATSFDPVGFEAATSEEPVHAAAAPARNPFDPVNAEVIELELVDEPLQFTGTADIVVADDVLSLPTDSDQTIEFVSTDVVLDDAPSAVVAPVLVDGPSVAVPPPLPAQAFAVEVASAAAAPDVVTQFDAAPVETVDVVASEVVASDVVTGSAVDDIAESIDDVQSDVVPHDVIAATDDDLPVDITSGPFDAQSPVSAPVVAVQEGSIGRIEVDDETAAFIAALDQAAASFDPVAVEAPPVAEDVVEPIAATVADEGVVAGFEDGGEAVDDDIREVFIEEFDEELVNLGALLPAWRAAPDNVERLRPIRRVFHTLKGSGRLVGARALGEFSWKIESLLNRVLDGSRPASPAVVALVTQAYEVLPQLNAALRDGTRVFADLDGMQAIAERVAAGEETYHVPPVHAPSGSAAPAADAAVDVDLAFADAPLASVTPPLAEGTPASVDSVLLEILEAEVETHQRTFKRWLGEAASQQDAEVDDALLRAVHTMNGAFAMTDVPEITSVTGAAERFIKRSFAAGQPAGPEAVAALAEASQAIDLTVTTLQGEQPRIPSFAPLAQRLQTLAEALPEASWQALHPAEHELDGVEPGSAGLDGAETIDAPLSVDVTPAAGPQDVHMLDAGDLDKTDDLSRFFDAGLLDAQVAQDAITPITATPSWELEDTQAAAAPEAGQADTQAADTAATVDTDLSVSTDAADWNVEAFDTAAGDSLGDNVVADPATLSLDFVDDGSTQLLEEGTPDAELVELLDDTAAQPEFGETVELAQVEAEGLTVFDASELQANDDSKDIAAELDAQLAGSYFEMEQPLQASVTAEAEPVVEDLAVEESVVEVPAVDEPVVEEPALEEPAIEEPLNEEPVIEEPAIDEPVIEEPVAEAAAADDVASDASAAVEAVVEDAPVVNVAPDTLEDQPSADATGQPLDFSVLDLELVDIFVEEGKDLLDHCDGLISELREAPEDRDVLAGLQRDLHTLKGGARMAGINPIGDLGHAIESLLEAVASSRTELGRSDVQLLERGFDHLHQLLLRTGNHFAVEMPVELIHAFELRTEGHPVALDGVIVEATVEAAADAAAGVEAATQGAEPTLVFDETDDVVVIENVEADGIEAVGVETEAEADGAEASVAGESSAGALEHHGDTGGEAVDAGTTVTAEDFTEATTDHGTADAGAGYQADHAGASIDDVEVAADTVASADAVASQEMAQVDAQADAAADAEPLASPEAQQPLDAPVAVVPAVAAPVIAAIPPAAGLAPLSAPVALETTEDEEGIARPQQEQVRVRADLLDRLVNHAGEVAIYRSRLEQQLGAFRGAMSELDRTNARLRDQLRRLDLETEAQIVARYQREQDQADQAFDPLELDRFSTLQQLSRALNESAADLGGLQGVLDDLARQYDSLLQQQSRVSSELQDGLMRARMVPFDGLVPRLRRVVRQAGMDTGKQVHLTLEGAHGELDRNVLDRMVAPLEHMLRNSVAHGLEKPAQRRAASKHEEGEVAIRLRREGSEIVLEVSDDGAGLDREAIRRRAEQRGLISPGAVLADSELDSLIFASGFSTADQVSQLAGRGVGMDVVRNEVRQLGGTVDIESVRGQGTCFTLRLPQTLAVTQAVFVKIGETTFAVPVASVSGIGRISRDRFESGDGGYNYSGEHYTLYDLGTLVGQDAAKAEGHEQIPLLLVRAGDLRAAVAIDAVVGNREIVVKPVGMQIASVPGIYGATITGDGQVVVILDVAPLVRRHLAQPQRPVAATPAAAARHVPLVMVVDDSLTMRKVTGRILERHNFEVSVARDGIEALERLDERVPDLMLLDIEMPRMDGYELATTMRADPRYKHVPIVMITSRSGDKHRQRAFEIGVQRYLGKPYQELDLMRNVYDLLGIARVRE